MKKIQETHLENIVEYSNKGDKEKEHKDRKEHRDRREQGEFKEHRNYKKRGPNYIQRDEENEANNEESVPTEELQREDSGNYNHREFDNDYKYRKNSKKY